MNEKIIYPSQEGVYANLWRKIRLSLFFLSVFLLPVVAGAVPEGDDNPMQQITIKGKVLDSETNAGLPGVNVVVKGTTIGKITDVNGEFSIDVPNNDAKLVFSFIGYVPQEINVKGKTVIDVTMKPEVTGLEEVVVTGYSTQRKATLTGAVVSIKTEDLVVTKNENVVNMLTGKLTGVRVAQKSSAPGDYNSVIDIRGMGTPLFIVDGVTRDQDYFSRMDASEIDNISVLKDGSAAIYGLRAANGVVLITTKRGTAQDGKVDITYSGNYSVSQFLKVPYGVSALDYMMLRNEQTFQDFNLNYLARQAPYFTQAAMQPFIDGKPSYDWMGAIFKKSTLQHQHNLSVDGGTDKLRYFMNLSYFSHDGNYRSGDYYSNRWNFRMNVDAQITKRLQARVLVGAIMDETNKPFGNIMFYKQAWLMRPDIPIYANDNPLYLNGETPGLYDGHNMVAQSYSDIVGYMKDINRRLNGTLQLSYDIPGIKGFSAKGSFDYSTSMPDETTYKRSYDLYVYNSGSQVYTPTTKSSPTTIERRSDRNYDTDMKIGLYYSNKFGNHNFNSFLIFEEAYLSREWFSAYRELIVESEYLFAGEDLNQRATGGSPYDRVAQSLIGSFTYDYSGKYLFDFRFRYDGSSRFPEGSQWGFFPSVSAGWRLSEENFMKDNIPGISNLKIRASYGEMGDDQAAGNYPPTLGYSLTNSIGWQFNEILNGGVQPQPIPNPNLTWYEIKSYNLALDFGILNNTLSGTFEIYRRDRTGLLATSTAVVPGTVGASLPQENLNADRNFGWEFSLDYRKNINKFYFTVSPQISSTRSMRTKWLETTANNQFDYWRNRTSGRYNNIWWNNESQHMFTSMEEIRTYNLPMGQGATPGDWILNDWNGDGVVNDNDTHPIATTGLPLFNYGINASASWKNFDFTMNWAGAQGVFVQYNSPLILPMPFNSNNTMYWFVDRWRPTDPNADYFSPATEWIPGYYPLTMHTGRSTGTNLVQNSSFLRLKTVELGYTLPKNLLSKLKIKNLRVYLSGYNLLTFTPLKFMDPERPGVAGGGASTGTNDHYEYPVSRIYTLGASIKF